MLWRRFPAKVAHPIPRRSLFNNFTKDIHEYPNHEEWLEFIVSSIKVITFSSVVWGFESHRKYQLHHLEVNHRILSNYVDCLQRQNTKHRCQTDKDFLDYIFKPEY